MTENRIAEDRVVVVRYHMKDENGRELDSSDDGEPITYIHGHDQILPGLERALDGKAAGDKASVMVEAEDGFGPHHDELVIQVPRGNLEFEAHTGMVVEARRGDGQSHYFQVVEVTDDSVTLDGNHPLAGRTLQFDVEVESVRTATSEELESVGEPGRAAGQGRDGAVQ
jgi:FKBP-type peptidyl-prolyl cis-trans isomerase SlyD